MSTLEPLEEALLQIEKSGTSLNELLPGLRAFRRSATANQKIRTSMNQFLSTTTNPKG